MSAALAPGCGRWTRFEVGPSIQDARALPHFLLQRSALCGEALAIGVNHDRTDHSHEMSCIRAQTAKGTAIEAADGVRASGAPWAVATASGEGLSRTCRRPRR